MHERPWLSPTARLREAEITAALAAHSTAEMRIEIERLIRRNAAIHEHECVNLNPATNTMSPRVEAALGSGLGTRPSLGHAGEKYETGLEAVEQLEVITADLACRVFDSRFAEIRVTSGAMANLSAFMATCRPGDSVIVPPASIGGHVTHNTAGAAGLYGLEVHEAPIDPDEYTIDVPGVASLADRVRPVLITVGSSLNLKPHPVAELRAVADAAGALLMFDAAHLCGVIAGRAWANPLRHGAHLMTMSTYKSLAGPPGGLLVTNEPEIAARVDSVAYPGLTANFDVGRTTALALTLLDWVDFGEEYAASMISTARVLASALHERNLPVFRAGRDSTTSHQFAVEAGEWGGGDAMARRLRSANILTSSIGLPTGSGLRIGTPEIVRWGMSEEHMPRLADLISRALRQDPEAVAAEVTTFRSGFDTVGYCA